MASSPPVDADTVVDAPRGVPRTTGAPIVPGYSIVRMVGRGGMGVVWEVIDHRLERRVALKVHSGGAAAGR